MASSSSVSSPVVGLLGFVAVFVLGAFFGLSASGSVSECSFSFGFGCFGSWCGVRGFGSV